MIKSARFIHLCLAAFFAAVAIPEIHAMNPSEQRPNIIFFMTDDQGWGDLGCYGHPVIQTPNLDRFAAEGALFTDFHAASAVCSPARAAMLTGRTPYRNGQYTIHFGKGETPYLRTSEVTLPAQLKQAGYATCHVGKWHLGFLDGTHGHPTPADHGYDHWFATKSNAEPDHLNPTNFIRNGEPCGEIEGNSVGIVVDEAIDWLENAKPAEAPFFITVWPHEPHTPIGTEARFSQPYIEQGIDPHDADYFGNITQIDAAFGRLMDYLEANGLAENTLVLFTSDNGPAWDPKCLERVRQSAGHHRGTKAWMYEGGHRVPGLIRWPGVVPAGAVSHETIVHTDLFPTVHEIVGLEPPPDRVIDGRSILPVLRGGAMPEPERPLYWRYQGADGQIKVAYREGDWVLLADADLDYCELYNLAEDWQQRDNLVYEESERFAAMKPRMVALHKEIEKDGPNEWWRENPDPLVPWKQRSVEGITRHLLGLRPEPRPAPYPAERWPGTTAGERR
ncbi:MAG: sulfatase [Opitutales bacterium]